MTLQEAIVSLVKEACGKLQLENIPRVILKKTDNQHLNEILAPTAYYSPDEKLIALYITNRHPKDILRSLAHELIHYKQDERGDLTNIKTKPGYAQESEYMRDLEKEAYLEGNMMFRDWEDKIKYNG
jgi:Zn-dependent peptidase ImmA (M78 family)